MMHSTRGGDRGRKGGIIETSPSDTSAIQYTYSPLEILQDSHLEDDGDHDLHQQYHSEERYLDEELPSYEYPEEGGRQQVVVRVLPTTSLQQGRQGRRRHRRGEASSSDDEQPLRPQPPPLSRIPATTTNNNNNKNNNIKMDFNLLWAQTSDVYHTDREDNQDASFNNEMKIDPTSIRGRMRDSLDREDDFAAVEEDFDNATLGAGGASILDTKDTFGMGNPPMPAPRAPLPPSLKPIFPIPFASSRKSPTASSMDDPSQQGIEFTDLSVQGGGDYGGGGAGRSCASTRGGGGSLSTGIFTKFFRRVGSGGGGEDDGDGDVPAPRRSGNPQIVRRAYPGDKPPPRKRRMYLAWIGVAALVLMIVLLASVCGSGYCSSNNNSPSSATSSSSESAVAAAAKRDDDGDNKNKDRDKKKNNNNNNKSNNIFDEPSSAPSDGNSNNNSDNGVDDNQDQDEEEPDTPSTTSGGTKTIQELLNVNERFDIIVIDPTWTTAEIQNTLDSIFQEQVNNEMGTQRYSVLLEPGTYGTPDEPLMIQLGYYTQMAGLGPSPDDVTIYGKVEVYNRCFESIAYQDGEFNPISNDDGQASCFALNNFWRSLSNVHVNIVATRWQDTCRATANFWAISQASSMRRVRFSNGNVSLMDYCTNPGYASGGFVSDSRIEGTVISGSQQQWITRNSYVGAWEGSVWNQVFVGVTNAPSDGSYPDPPFTTVGENPLSREHPYLYLDPATKAPHVFVPGAAADTRGVTWDGGFSNQAGQSLSVESDFFLVTSSTPVSEINQNLAVGKHLLVTPGVYDIDESVVVNNPDTVILGMGHATFTAVNGAVPLVLSHQPGIVVAGMTIDAGTVLSPALLQVGEKDVPYYSYDDSVQSEHKVNPITLSDVYFRLGGPHIGRAEVCLEINSHDVLIDHTWVWRADHGVEEFDVNDGFQGDNVRWATNIGTNGVVVNGDNVFATGLFVEHFQEYNVVWNGENGNVIFFQNELPYEPGTQEEWTAPDGTLGYAAYKVSDDVTRHELLGGGVYCYNRNNPDVVTANGFEVPIRDDGGIQLRHVYTRNLSGPGSILSVVNGVGGAVDENAQGPNYVVQYP